LKNPFANPLFILIPCIFLSCNNAKTNNETGRTQERPDVPAVSDTIVERYDERNEPDDIAAGSEFNPMNKMDIGFLFLLTSDGNSRFRIEGDQGFYSSEYGMNIISMSFIRREAGSVLAKEDPFLKMRVDFYRQAEMFVDGDLDRVRFPLESDTTKINVNRRKNIRNGLIFVDSFVFGGVQDASPQLMRRIYLTTNNYFIDITMSARMYMFDDVFWQRELIDKKIPYYEKAEPNGLRPGQGVFFVFNGETVFYNINAERFGDDIINRRHPTQEVMQWYDETEKISDGLKVDGPENAPLISFLLNGTWLLTTGDAVDGEMTLDNGSFEYYSPPYRPYAVSKGIYTISGATIFFTQTHSHGSPFDLHFDVLYSKDDVKSRLQMTDEDMNESFPNFFISYTAEYFPDDDIWITERGITYKRGQATVRESEPR
jgi:hypothetical protein